MPTYFKTAAEIEIGGRNFGKHTARFAINISDRDYQKFSDSHPGDKLEQFLQDSAANWITDFHSGSGKPGCIRKIEPIEECWKPVAELTWISVANGVQVALVPPE